MKFDDHRTRSTQRPGQSGTRPETTSRTNAGGFQLPSQQRGKTKVTQNPNRDLPQPYNQRPQVQYTQPYQTSRRPGVVDFFRNISLRGFPWRPVIIVLLVVLGIVLLVVFRNEITDFLGMLLSWTLMIGAIALILWLIFHRRRR